MAKISLSSKFAHLIGLPGARAAAPAAGAPAPAAAAAAAEDDEDDERKKKDGETDEQHAARLAEMDKEDENCEDSEKEKEARTAGHAEGLAAGTIAGTAAGAAAECTRWSTVFASEHAAGRIAMAATLLSENPAMTAESITKVLAVAPRETARATLATRTAAEPAVPVASPDAEVPAVGSDAEFARNAMAAADKFRPDRGGKKPAPAAA